METKIDSHLAVPVYSKKMPTLKASWETGSPKPSDNLLIHRIVTEYFPIADAAAVSTSNTTTIYMNFLTSPQVTQTFNLIRFEFSQRNAIAVLFEGLKLFSCSLFVPL